MILLSTTYTEVPTKIHTPSNLSTLTPQLNKTTSITPVTQRDPLIISSIDLRTSDLIKFNLLTKTHWSAGMVSSLLFTYDEVYSKKFLNVLNARKDWTLWKYAHLLLWESSSAQLAIISTWSIRTRRFLKLTNNTSFKFITLHFSNNQFYTPNRRIKRWLKKKYTTQAWR